jgi:hypothetical protein
VASIEEKMIEAPISTPPQAYMDIISPQIDKARNFLEVGEKLQPFAFVGNLTTKEIIPVMIQPGSGEDKDQSARLIQSAALVLDADFVFVIMEAWALRPDKIRQMDAIVRQVRKHRRFALRYRCVRVFAGNEAWDVGLTTADQTQGNLQEKTDNWGGRVSLFHGSSRHTVTDTVKNARLSIHAGCQAKFLI